MIDWVVFALQRELDGEIAMSWIKISSGIVPPSERVLLCYCPEWNETGYQVAMWDKNKGFYYHEQPNDMFHDLVEEWSIFMEAD
jgi:hypothetical protein